MWVFTRDGFYSAVADKKDPSTLMIRARDEGDIAALAARCGTTWTHTPDADYAYRTVVKRAVFGRYLAAEAEGIDYENFKSMVMRRIGVARERIYADVWSVLRSGLQPWRRPTWATVADDLDLGFDDDELVIPQGWDDGADREVDDGPFGDPALVGANGRPRRYDRIDDEPDPELVRAGKRRPLLRSWSESEDDLPWP